MNRIFKFLLILIIALIAIIALAFAALNYFLTPEKLKKLITEQVSQHSDMSININGEVHWSLYPHLGIRADRFILNNDHNPNEKITVGDINISIKLLPLLHKEIRPQEFDLNNITYQSSPKDSMTIDSLVLKADSMSLNQSFPFDLSTKFHNQDMQANIHLVANALINDDFNHVQLNDYQLTVNDNTFTGDLSVSGFNQADAAKPVTQSLTIDGTTNCQKLQVNHIKLSNIAMTVSGNNGIYIFNPIKADMYDGSMNGKLTANFQNTLPTFTIQANASNLAMGDLIFAVAGKNYLDGTGAVDINLVTKGLDEKTITNNLNGTIIASIENGKITELDINKMISQALILLKQSDNNNTLNKPITFSSVTSNIALTNGKGTIKGKLTSKSMLAKAKGKLNLPNQYLKMDLDAKYINSDKTKDITIPIQISGQLDDLGYSLDKGDLLKQLASQKGKKLQDQINKQLGTNLDFTKLLG